MLLSQCFNLGLHRTGQCECQAPADLEALCFPSGDDQLPVEFWIPRETQFLGVHTQPVALLDAGENFEVVVDDLIRQLSGVVIDLEGGIRRQFAGSRGCTEMAAERGR